jgi:hypothetical protein
VLRAFCQDALHELQTKRCGRPDHFRIVVRRKGGPALRKGITEAVHGNLFYGTTVTGKDKDDKDTGKKEISEIVIPPATRIFIFLKNCHTRIVDKI